MVFYVNANIGPGGRGSSGGRAGPMSVRSGSCQGQVRGSVKQ